MANLSANDRGERLVGSPSDDTLVGGAGDDVLLGRAGADQLLGGPGADLLRGGDGDDVLIDEAGSDRFSGGIGTDELLVRADGCDRLDGGGGDDRLSLYGFDAMPDRVRAGDGDDFVSVVLSGPTGRAGISGGSGRDTLDLFVDPAIGVAFDLRIAAQRTVPVALLDRVLVSGFERLRAETGSGDDTLHGGGLADDLRAGGGDDLLEGFGGADVLDGGIGRDTLRGGGGDDLLRVDVDVDVDAPSAGAGDELHGGAGTDTLELRYLDQSPDVPAIVDLRGVRVPDRAFVDGVEDVTSFGGRERIIGNDSSNRITTDLGADTITGAGGADVFSFGFDAADAAGMSHLLGDVVTDFEFGIDRLELRGLLPAFDGPGGRFDTRVEGGDTVVEGVNALGVDFSLLLLGVQLPSGSSDIVLA